MERDVELFFFDLSGQDVYDSITNELVTKYLNPKAKWCRSGNVCIWLY